MKVKKIVIDREQLEKVLEEIGWKNILQVEHLYDRPWRPCFRIMYVKEE